jgi:hypothetical protein
MLKIKLETDGPHAERMAPRVICLDTARNRHRRYPDPDAVHSLDHRALQGLLLQLLLLRSYGTHWQLEQREMSDEAKLPASKWRPHRGSGSPLSYGCCGTPRN